MDRQGNGQTSRSVLTSLWTSWPRTTYNVGLCLLHWKVKALQWSKIHFELRFGSCFQDNHLCAFLWSLQCAEWNSWNDQHHHHHNIILIVIFPQKQRERISKHIVSVEIWLHETSSARSRRDSRARIRLKSFRCWQGQKEGLLFVICMKSISISLKFNTHILVIKCFYFSSLCIYFLN